MCKVDDITGKKFNRLTQERLKELLHYDPDNGLFTWNKRMGGSAKKGKVAGTAHSGGYIQIRIDKKIYLAHRLAFLYIEGYMPENEVDHVNRIKDDNRWCNLRHVSRSCNARNTSICGNNKSGVTGVSQWKAGNKWRAIITVLGINKHLGIFKSFEEAVMARWKAEIENNYSDCCTYSTAYNYLKNKGLLPPPYQEIKE